VVLLKDRIFLTRLHKPGSISAFHAYSNRLLPLVAAADSASSVCDTKLIIKNLIVKKSNSPQKQILDIEINKH
jgi:hypothetical protein